MNVYLYFDETNKQFVKSTTDGTPVLINSFYYGDTYTINFTPLINSSTTITPTSSIDYDTTVSWSFALGQISSTGVPTLFTQSILLPVTQSNYYTGSINITGSLLSSSFIVNGTGSTSIPVTMQLKQLGNDGSRYTYYNNNQVGTTIYFDIV